MSLDVHIREIADDINAGKPARLYYAEIDADRRRPKRPGTKAKFSGQTSGKIAYNAKKLANGVTAVKKVMTITVTAVPADAETVTVDGTALTFDATPTADQIDTSGGTNNSVAAAIAQEINDQVATVVATVLTNVVTVTAVTAGDDFTITDGTGGDITIATLTANVVGVGASKSFTIEGTHVADTTAILTLRGILISNVIEDVELQYDIQEGDSDTDIAAALVACGIAAQGGDPAPANSRYASTNYKNEVDDIAAGIVLKYGNEAISPAAFSNVAGVVTVKALAAKGALGNDYEIATRFAPAPAEEVPVDANGVPQKEGIKSGGYLTDLAPNFSGSSGDILTDQVRQSVKPTVGTFTGELTGNIICDENDDIISDFSGFGDIAHTDTETQHLVNYNESQRLFAFYLVVPDGRIDGAFRIVELIAAGGTGFQLGAKLREHTPVPFSLKSQTVPGGDETAIIHRSRPAVVAA